MSWPHIVSSFLSKQTARREDLVARAAAVRHVTYDRTESELELLKAVFAEEPGRGRIQGILRRVLDAG
jgi:hypothetical protein